MGIINTVFGIPLGYLMHACYRLLQDYGLSILLFTLLTKIIMFPLSLISQKNSIIMVKMRPMLEDIKQRNMGNNALIVEEQKALFKQEGYSTLKGMLPLLLQIPLILGLINVIYHPLQHLLRFEPELIQAYLQQATTYLGVSLESLGSGQQLKVLELAQQNPQIFSGLEGLSQVVNMDVNFLGTNLAQVPQLTSITVLYPILSGLSALLLSLYQNKHNVLQREQGAFSKWGMTIFLVLFSAFFAYILPAGIGLYWIAGNLLSIPVLYLCNRIYNPKDYIDSQYATVAPKLTKEEKAKLQAERKEMRKRQKADMKRFSAQKNKQLVFYSEASGFYKYFKGFIEHVLASSDIVIHYVTNDLNDQVFQNTNPQLQTYFVGPIALIQFMMRMDADMVVMTTPDLEKYHLKRSLVRKDIEYVYLDHGMTSFHLMLKKGALDHFDTIFCYGPNHITEVRQTEELYQLPAKKLVKTGFPLLDSMIKSAEAISHIKNSTPTILIAPSWQKDNLLEYCLDETVRPLLGLGYKIIIRPHPEFIKRFPQKIQKILDTYSHEIGENFIIQTDFSSSETVYTADLVITDWSSIAHEFSYATKKPSLFINTPMKVMNPEYTRIQAVPLDLSLRDEIGVSVDVENLNSLPEVIEKLFAQEAWYRNHITQVVMQNIYDVGDGARGGGEYIIHRLAEVSAARNQAPGEAPIEDPDSKLLNTLDTRMLAYFQGREQSQVISGVLNQAVPQSELINETKGEMLLSILNDIEHALEESRSV